MQHDRRSIDVANETILLNLVSLCILGKRFNVTENPMDLTDREMIAPVPIVRRTVNPIVTTEK